MNEQVAKKIAEITSGTVIVLLLPIILASSIGAWLVCRYLLDDDERYILFRKW